MRSKKLRADLNPCSHRDQLPDFFNLGIRDGNAAVRPVGFAVEWPQISERPGQSMDHDCSAGRLSHTARFLLVRRAGIRDVQRQRCATTSETGFASSLRRSRNRPREFCDRPQPAWGRQALIRALLYMS
jgi:hypothetical protein